MWGTSPMARGYGPDQLRGRRHGRRREAGAGNHRGVRRPDHGEEAQIQEFKQAVQDFLNNGPGMPQQRRQALLKHMTGWAPQFKDFLISPN